MTVVLPWGRPIDTPDGLEYLNDVEAECLTDPSRYSKFLSLISNWDEPDCSCISFSALSQISGLLKKPKLIRGLNAILPCEYRIDCSVDVNEVEFLVLSTPTYAQILSPHTDVPRPASTSELKAFVCRPEYSWEELVFPRDPRQTPQWLGCVSQLLHWELEHETLATPYKSKLDRLQRKLARRVSVLPPSIFLHNVICVNKHAVSGGGFAEIHQGHLAKRMVCLKVLRLYQGQEDYDKKLKDFSREVLIWSRLSHPNVLQFLGANKGLFPSFCLISPWMKNGNLRDYIKHHPEHDRLISIREVACGLAYLHELEPPVFHRDVKGVNILVADDLRCCVADFGLSLIDESQRRESHSLRGAGSTRWQAPEITGISSYSDSEERYPAAGDVYALGCTAAEIYSNKIPFSQYKNDAQVILALTRGERPDLTLPEDESSDRLGALVKSCWREHPEERPSMQKVEQLLESILSDRSKSAKEMTCSLEASNMDQRSLDSSPFPQEPHTIRTEPMADVKLAKLSTAPIDKNRIDLPPLVKPTVGFIQGILGPTSPGFGALNLAASVLDRSYVTAGSDGTSIGSCDHSTTKNTPSNSIQGSHIADTKPTVSPKILPHISVYLPTPPETPTLVSQQPSATFVFTPLQSPTRLRPNAPAFVPPTTTSRQANNHRLSIDVNLPCRSILSPIETPMKRRSLPTPPPENRKVYAASEMVVFDPISTSSGPPQVSPTSGSTQSSPSNLTRLNGALELNSVGGSHAGEGELKSANQHENGTVQVPSPRIAVTSLSASAISFVPRGFPASNSMLDTVTTSLSIPQVAVMKSAPSLQSPSPSTAIRPYPSSDLNPQAVAFEPTSPRPSITHDPSNHTKLRPDALPFQPSVTPKAAKLLNLNASAPVFKPRFAHSKKTFA